MSADGQGISGWNKDAWKINIYMSEEEIHYFIENNQRFKHFWWAVGRALAVNLYLKFILSKFKANNEKMSIFLEWLWYSSHWACIVSARSNQGIHTSEKYHWNISFSKRQLFFNQNMFKIS